MACVLPAHYGKICQVQSRVPRTKDNPDGPFGREVGRSLRRPGRLDYRCERCGVTVAENLGIPVTTGDSSTVAAAVEATKSAAKVMKTDLTRGVVALSGGFVLCSW